MVYMHVAMTKQRKDDQGDNINMMIRPINQIEVFSKFSYVREEMFAGNDSLSSNEILKQEKAKKL